MIQCEEGSFQVNKQEVKSALVGKAQVIPTSTYLNYFPIEIKSVLDEFDDIIFYKLPTSFPLVKIINHHIEFILGSRPPNNPAYGMTPSENDEVRRNLNEFLNKLIIK